MTTKQKPTGGPRPDEERKIALKAFAYTVKVKDPITDEDRPQERLGRRGETHVIPWWDLDRGDRLGAFVVEEERPAAAEDEERVLDPHEAGLDELTAWIEQDKPTVQEVVDAADGSAVTARKLLDAENAATGNEPRKGVVEGLTTVIQRESE